MYKIASYIAFYTVRHIADS